MPRKQGVNPDWLASYENALHGLEARLTPVYLTGAMPQDYNEETLTSALARRLLPEELSKVVNPLAGNGRIARWARELTKGSHK